MNDEGSSIYIEVWHSDTASEPAKYSLKPHSFTKLHVLQTIDQSEIIVIFEYHVTIETSKTNERLVLRISLLAYTVLEIIVCMYMCIGDELGIQRIKSDTQLQKGKT